MLTKIEVNQNKVKESIEDLKSYIKTISDYSLIDTRILNTIKLITQLKIISTEDNYVFYDKYSKIYNTRYNENIISRITDTKYTKVCEFNETTFSKDIIDLYSNDKHNSYVVFLDKNVYSIYKIKESEL